VVQLIKVWH